MAAPLPLSLAAMLQLTLAECPPMIGQSLRLLRPSFHSLGTRRRTWQLRRKLSKKLAKLSLQEETQAETSRLSSLSHRAALACGPQLQLSSSLSEDSQRLRASHSSLMRQRLASVRLARCGATSTGTSKTEMVAAQTSSPLVARLASADSTRPMTTV